MKKFAKILGFLGFFVTVATVQIGTAWGDGAHCYADGYYGLGRVEGDCHPCREHNEDYPNSTGNYNFSEDLCYQNCSGSCVDANSSFQNGGTYGIPDEFGFIINRLNNNGAQNSLLNINGLTCVNIGNYCAEVFNCGKNACSANWKTINFVDHNNNQLGTLYIVYSMIWSTQQTTECNNCAQDSRNYAVFYPVFQTPTAPTREGYTFLGYSDSQTGGSIRIEPYRDNMYGKLNYNNATNISGISGNTITLYARYENAGCAQNYWYNSQTDECIPCAEGFTSPGGYYGQEYCTKTCEIDCTEQHAPENECEAPLIGHYSPATFRGTEYEIDIPAQNIESGKCYDRNNNEITHPSDNSAYWCPWSCDGCSPAGCYELMEGACVPKKYIATYKCDGQNEYSFQDPTSGKPTYGEIYNLFDVTSFGGPGACNPQPNSGQSFAGWVLDIDVPNQTVRTYPDSFEWKWCSDGNFTPSWTDTCYEVRFDDDTNGGHPSGYPNPTPGTHGPFYKKYNDTQYNWYTDSKCTEKVNGGNPSVANNLPWKEHAQFTGYKDEDGTNWTIFNANGNLTTGSNSGSDWTIDGDTVLYAQYTCDENYELNADGDCVGDKIDVKYTCVSPVDGEPDTHTFYDDATYGAAYIVKSVGTGNHEVLCAFTGYELDNNYVWNLQDYSGNSDNPNGEYGPGADAGSTLLSGDWRYITTSPLTEIEFILNKSLWHLKTYTVEYHCGEIKPYADVYTDSSATYGQTYSVAGQFDPIGGNAVTVQDFLDTNCKPDGGFGAWTFQNWTFTCAGANPGPYNTNDPMFGTWTYDSNNCYFTANWAQTDFVITLGNQDGVSQQSDPYPYLYTRKGIGVFLDSGRENAMSFNPNGTNPLVTTPKKSATVTINGGGGTFEWGENPSATLVYPNITLAFNGFYENTNTNPTQYIGSDGYITEAGHLAGRGYDHNETWNADWGTGTITLPSTATWDGHDFAGWKCVDDEDNTIYTWTPANNSSPVVQNISENITCNAQWSVACRQVMFDDATNHGTSTNGGNNNRFSKVSGVPGWYDGTACGGSPIAPSVVGRIPTKTNGRFIGYNTAVDGTGYEIFNESGNVTTYGSQTWAPVDNATLYAQYKCDEPYHLDTDSESGTYGQCVACAPGFFYDQTELNPAKQCKNCNEYIHDHGASGSGAYTWTSKDPYNWSINQCYRVCNSKKCTAKDFAEGHRIEQFVTLTQEGNDLLGNQISFYGNEFNNSNQGQNFDACANNEFEYCPQGLLEDSGNPDTAAEALKTISAPVKFYGKCDDNGIDCEELSDRYIVGNRGSSDGLVVLQNGFAWSHSVGEAQLTGIPSGNRYTVIIYPTDAPTPSQQQNMTFTGYRYPRMGTTAAVTTNGVVLDGAIAGAIITYAGQHDYQDMSPIVYNNNYTRNLYAQYTAADSYTLTYNCGEGGGIPPAQQTNIYAGNTVPISVPSNCSHYSTHSLTEWAVTATEGGQRLETVPAGNTSFTWDYDQNVTFTAVWGNANTHSIIYNKIPVDNVNTGGTTNNGNTYVPGVSGGTPTQFTCGSGTTPITGQPQLKNSDGDVIGEVKQWCDDDDLSSNCALPKNISNDTCNDKNVYAKWECTDPRYHLNEDENDCVVCDAGEYWDEDEGCKSCSLIGAGWTSKPGYNQSIDQCYRICDGSNGTSNVSCVSPDGLPHPSFIMLPIVSGENHQIEFYGNWRNLNNNPELDVCGTNSASVTYCARIIRAPLSTHDADRLMSSKVIFKKKGNTENAGNRHLVGYTPAVPENPSEISFVTNKNKIWSHIMGPGQYTTGSDGRHYVYAIYPTDTAPEPSVNAASDPLFKGYFDGTGSDATPHVAAALGLDSTNAVAFAQTPLSLNQIGDRILYPQYCENGQEWDPNANNGAGACIAQAQVYDVKYVCNGGVVETDRATYDQTYTVLNHDSLTGCTAPDGKVFVGWGFSNNGITPYLAEYEDGEEFIWQHTVQQPTFTAIWDDGCYKVTFNNTLFGGQDPLGAAVTFYKKGTNWYAWNDSTCTYPQTPNIYSLPTKQNAEFLGYDEDSTSPVEVDFVFVKSGSNAVLTTYGQTWTITGDTTLYAKYDCDDGYTLNGTTCVLDSSNFHTITLDENAGEFYGVASDPNVLYTIEGTDQTYTDSEHNDPFYSLNENGFPRKYAKVTFHYCNGTNNSCDSPLTQNEIKDADFIFNGFYATTPATGQRYINSEGDMLLAGNNAAAAATTDTRWYADWNGYGMLDVSRWPVPNQSQTPAGYTFGGWYTAPKCEGTPMSSSTQFATPDTDLYACWSQNAFTVTYNCGNGQPVDDYTDPVTVALNGTYTVLANGAVPNGQGGFVTCNLSGQGFNGWKFSGNGNTYNSGDQITWLSNYGNETMSAQYRTCNSNEVLVNGVCYPTCSDTTCTEPAQQNSQSHCPTNHTPLYPHNDVSCSYSWEDVSGYLDGGVCKYADGDSQGQPINIGVCQETVVCNDSAYVWNSDPTVWACVPNTGITYNVQFKCNETDSAPISGYSFSVSYGGSITVPLNSVCQKPGYSYSQWKATQYNNPATLPAQGTTYQYPWEQTHGETFIADWNDGNVYHVTLAQTDATTNATVQDLYEKYANGWGYTETGPWNDGIILRDDQLPRRTGYTFGGYKDEYGNPKGIFNNDNTWTTPDATTVTRDQTWTPIWTRCSDPYFYYDETSGQCKECESMFHDNPVPGTHEGCYSNCSESCQPNTSVCSIPNAVTYTLVTNVSYSGKQFYPGNAGCQLDIWATEPELNGMIPNCECRVQTCETGYHPNNDNTACVPNSWTVNYYCGDSNAHNGSASGMTMWNTATYGQDYKVAYDTQNTNTQIADCNVRNGYILNNWKLNNSVGSTYSTGWSFPWLYEFTSTTPTFTAQYVCDTDNGYYQNQINGTCQQCPENSYWTGSQCKQCDPGYHVNDAGNNCIPNTINLVYSTSCGTSNPSSTTCTFNNGFNLATHNTSTGYTFNGWTTNGNTYTGPFNPEQQIQCTAEYLGSAVYINNATVTITGSCASNDELCPAQLPASNSHATLVSGVPNSGGTQCIYTLQCDACIGCNPSLYTCYTNGNSANNNGMFTVNGPIGDTSVLNNVSCNATQYDVRYRCNSNTAGTVSSIKATYGQSYTVEYNNTTVQCTDSELSFSGWNFNGEPSGNPSYFGGDQITWNYCNLSQPTFTAYYSQCSEGQIYVPCLGECKPKCSKPCTWPGAGTGTDLSQCPTGYPTGTLCYYNTSVNQAYGYIPEGGDSGACYSTSSCSDLTPNQCPVNGDPICPDPDHYTWNPNTRKCEPNIYSVTLDKNGGIEGPAFVDKLYEQYGYGWSTTNSDFTPDLSLAPNELPMSSEECKVFVGYFTASSGGFQRIQQSGFVSQNGYNSLPATTLTSNNVRWYAHYDYDHSREYTIKFRCPNGGEYSTTVHMGDTNLLAPAAAVCSGVAFNQWKGSTHPEILLDAGSYFAWNHCFDEVFIPDTKAVYHVDLNENGGDFPSDDYRELWYAVDMGWYKDDGLAPADRITFIPGDQLPIKTNSNFNGWLDNATQQPRGSFNSANWRLPDSISTDETWDAQWGPCAAGQFWDGGVCKDCSEATGGAYPNALPNATSINQCYKVCHDCIDPMRPTGEGITGYTCDHDLQLYNGYLFFNSVIPNPNSCVGDTGNPIQCTNCCVTCATGYEPGADCNSCAKKGFIIDLKSHRKRDLNGEFIGDEVSPIRLYVWSHIGVYKRSNYTAQMTPYNGQSLGGPTTGVVVRFNPNAPDVTFALDGYTYTNTYGDRQIMLPLRGFYNLEDGSEQYIGSNGVITESGEDTAKETDIDLTWHAQWTSRTIGTLPQPTRPGYRFVGWFSDMTNDNGYQISANTSIYQSMNVYARWEKAKYSVNLDRNGGQWGSDPVDKLWELYGTGWSTEEYGTFNSNLTLDQSQLPSYVNNSKIFDGYWTQRTGGGIQQIRADGSVVDTSATTLTESGNTWYARYVDNNGTFKITFRCGDNEPPLGDYTQHVQNGGTVRVPPKSMCPNAGRSFTTWMGDHNTIFTARDTEYMATWSDVFADEDFTPNWVSDGPYQVTLLQTGATIDGDVQYLYEKYNEWWAFDVNGYDRMYQLSGDDLPSKINHDFGGFKLRGTNYTRGNFDSENGIWTPLSNTEIVRAEEWEPIWRQCKPYWYYDEAQKICKECPAPYTNNETPESLYDCYDGSCELHCVEREEECPSDPNAAEFAYTDRTYPGTNYYENHCVLDIWVQQGSQQEVIPSCVCTIKTCKDGYHLVDGGCVPYVKTDIMLNPNGGTWSSNVPSEYRYLYTIESTGVYRNSARTEEMTPDNNVSLHAIPSNGVSITLDANGGSVTWGGSSGEIRPGSVAFKFNGFYDSQTPGFAATYILPQEINGETYAFITTGGQSAGMGYTTTPHTWYAQWNRSVTLPTPERQNYTFVGWTYNGELISNPWTVPVNATNITLVAQWTKNEGTIVEYNCDDGDGGLGGNGYDTQHPAYVGENYTVLNNGYANGGVVNCSKPANPSLNRRYHYFDNWQFSGDYAYYDPGYVFTPWTFTGSSNPTFTANYKECGDGYYFGSNGCQVCPGEYDHSNIDATQQQHCYRNCPIECNRVCPDEEGILDCTYTIVPYPVGTQYYGGDCQVNPGTTVESCDYHVICDTGYLPDANLKHCIRQNQHEITLDANCGGEVTLAQEKLYTTENIGVYLNPARINQYLMTISEHPLSVDDLPRCIVTATFNHCDNDGPNCDGATTEQKTVDLGFNGYYKAETNGTRYTDTRQEDGQLKSYITTAGMTDGKGYTENNTWYAHWNAGQVGNQKWPTAPTRPGRCSITAYTFGGWWTAPNGGESVSQNTPVNSNVTWYAHWCESCTDSIEHGLCSAPNCTATIACDLGYGWDETQCACVATTDLTLTYRPNGGTPDQNHEYLMTFGDTFTPLLGTTYTMENNRIAYWKRVTNNCSNLPQEFDFDESYTYNCNGNTILDAQWKECHCSYTMDSGVASCETFVDNNLCKTRFECKPGYVPMPLSECGGQYLTECGVNCTICPAGTYQNGNVCTPCGENEISAAGATQCTPCSEIYGDGYHANADHTQCEPNRITIDWDENDGNAIPDGFCVYGQTFTLANAPSHSNSAMQFLGWKLFTGDSTYPAGTNVMCTYDNVGVYSGTSTKIQAQWNECQCNYSDEDHVHSCQPINISGICMCFAECMPGYELIDETGTCNPECRAKTSNITYECGDGTGTPEYPADSATFDANYTVKGRGTCQMTGFNFAGWKLSADNQTYQPGYRFEPWNFTQQNPTFTAQYTNIQCASDEILIGNDCVKCNCTIGTGATSTSCGMLSTNFNTCEWTHPVTCQTGFVTPAWSCTGTGNTNCTASCSVCPENQVEVGGSCVDCECTPDTTTGAVSCGTRSVSNNMCNWGPAICTPGHHNPNITCSGSSNQSCEATCGTCPANTYGPDGLECIQCPDGYTSPAGSTSIEDCYNNPTSYTITYRPNDGVNPQTGNNHPVLQPVTYWADFTTLMGTTFTKDNHILTRWDLVGDDTSTFDKHRDPDTNQYYAKLHEYYDHYNTLGDTILDAHWEQCTCTLGTGAESCGTLSTAGNVCNWTSPVCQNGYVSPNLQCSGTGNINCTLTCGECAEGEIIVDGQCVPCTCTTGTGAASCTPGATANNTCTAVGQCLVGYGNENGNANVVCGGTNCVVSYNECGDGWVSNENCQCNECPANTYQSGNTCVPCQNGYTSPAGSSSADACVPGAHTIHYLSNNGTNETYNQGVYYGQSFVTEGGTRFTKVNNIMTQWKVENDATTTTFPTGIAGLSGDYVYGDTTDTTLEAQWAQCTCDADNCTTYATNSNTCACNATCPTGYTYGGCECDGTVCEPICTLGGSNAVYKCGTGIGTGYSTYVNYGATHTILTSAFVGCYRDNSTFAGWAFNGDNNMYFDNVGATVRWDYTTDKEFEARWCSNCPVVEHGTNLLTIPEPGLCRCDLTCDTGYHVENGTCEPNVYPNENGITYKPNGGTPNRNYTQSVTYDAPFTTLDWSVEHYTKAHHILKGWDVESGGAGTFNGGYADLGREYIYKTDGATVLAADWTECATDEISLNNTCRQCGCTNGTGAASCGTLSTDDDTCTWGPVSCQTGYVTPVLDCSNDTTNCTASCTACGTTQVEVNGTCENCVCDIVGDANGVISGCVFVSNNGNTCNWDPTTCRLGYGYPDLTCTETEHNNNCTASCTICPAGTYGDNGIECKQCPESYTSLAGATSIRECFVDPNSCAPDEHIEHGECTPNVRRCSIPDATNAVRIWNPAIGTYGPCTVEVDGCNPGYHVSGNVCVKDTEACTVEHGHGEHDWNGTSWGACGDVVCDPGYEPNSDYTACVECSNRRVNGDIAVSGYIYECEIAACMYQGQKYALQNGECVPICENASDETGTKVWDERTKKCIRTCNPGYKMW